MNHHKAFVATLFLVLPIFALMGCSDDRSPSVSKGVAKEPPVARHLRFTKRLPMSLEDVVAPIPPQAFHWWPPQYPHTEGGLSSRLNWLRTFGFDPSFLVVTFHELDHSNQLQIRFYRVQEEHYLPLVQFGIDYGWLGALEFFEIGRERFILVGLETGGSATYRTYELLWWHDQEVASIPFDAPSAYARPFLKSDEFVEKYRVGFSIDPFGIISFGAPIENPDLEPGQDHDRFEGTFKLEYDDRGRPERFAIDQSRRMRPS